MAYIELKVLNDDFVPGLALGIDLGTTNSLAAVWKDGRPTVIRPDGKNAKVPSIIHFPEDGQPTVGMQARAQAIVDPENTVYSIKRFMGRSAEEVSAEAGLLPYRVVAGERGMAQLEIRGTRYTPQELSALILMRIHDLACKALDGAEITRAVITVPAYFDDTQRAATRDAARLAGIDVLRIINEPTAASLAYGLDQKKEGKVAVYDLGGGTFDISILSIDGGIIRVLSTSGDTHLGGDDFDRVLMQLAERELADQLTTEELGEPSFLQGLRLAAERCKTDLSEHPEADFHVVIPEKGITWHRRVAREEFEGLTQHLIDRTLDSCRRALSDAELDADKIDDVLLVGGSTRMPIVRQRIEEFFGRKPHTEFNPDEVVALGAAVQANVLVGGSRDILLMDIIPLSLGLETMGGAISKVIQRNSTIPCEVTEGFTTYADNQTGMKLNIVQGERELVGDCRSLGQFELKGIPPMPAGMAQIAVKFHVDADGLLTVSAKEQKTGVKAHIEIQPMNGLTDGEVEKMLADSFANAKTDFDKRRIADLKTEIGIMLRSTERNMNTARERLDKESVLDLEDSIAAAKAAHESDELDIVQGARDGLERATMPLATVLMDSVAHAALSGKKLDEV